MLKISVLGKLAARCNLIGEDVSIIDQFDKMAFTKYGRKLKLDKDYWDNITDAIYNYISDRLGFSNEELLTDKEYETLISKGYILKHGIENTLNKLYEKFGGMEFKDINEFEGEHIEYLMKNKIISGKQVGYETIFRINKATIEYIENYK